MQRWNSWFADRRANLLHRSRPARNKTAALALEALEERTLLSGNPTLVAPIASNDVQPTDGATPLVLASVGYFSVVNGATLIPGSVKITTAPTHGNAVVDPATGDITYTAFAGFAGTDRIGFTVTDSFGLTSGQAIVNEVVTLPTANADTVGTESSNLVTIPVLANDASLAAALDPASVTLTSLPGHGTAVVNTTTGNIAYTSAATFSGTDSFSYTVKDANSVASNPATVSVVVNRPLANDDFATTPAGSAVVIQVLSQDTGPSKLVPGSVTVTSVPNGGSTIVDAATGSIKYTPNSGFSGTDSFTYTVADVNNAVSNAATVTVAVQKPTSGTAVNPVAASTDAGKAVVIDVLAVDSSPVGLAPNTVAVQSGPQHGATSVNAATGKITYTPVAGFTGTDAFTYTVNDNNGANAGSAVVSVVVNRPSANDGFGVTAAGNSVVIPVLASDSDVNNKLVPGSVKIVTGPLHGSVVVDPATGNVTYTADATFAGVDSFTYTVANTNNAVSNPATVTILANRPTANDAFGTTDSGFPITIDTLASATDPAGAAALVAGSVAIRSGPANGSVSIDPTTGKISYTSIPGFNGTDTVTYTVGDSRGGVSNVGTISIVVNRPTAVPESAGTLENSSVSLNVAGNDSDPDGNQFLVPGSVSIVSPPSHGYAGTNGAGSVTYTPNYGFTGTDSFAYTIGDAHGAVSNPAIDTITVVAPTPIHPHAPGTDGLVLLPDQPPISPPAGSDANTLFVGGLYRDVLGRPPDTNGLNGWVSQLQHGSSRTALALAFLHSSEHLTAEVSSYYQTILNRAPDGGGLNGWVKALQAGVSEQQVILGFVTSAEFAGQHSTSALYVNALYNIALGRDADAAGLAGWQAALDNHVLNRMQVAVGLLNSTESLQDLIDAYYAAYLARSADSSGEAGWISLLQNNQATYDSVAAAMLASTEYAVDLSLGIR